MVIMKHIDVKEIISAKEYEGKQVTTTYYKWNKNKKEFVLVPSMTVTMDAETM